MFDAWLETSRAPAPALTAALASAAAAIARLDEALTGHPLGRAFLHRARLDAVRRQAAVDGRLIDPWQLAAVLEGLRLRMTEAPRVIDRGEILANARYALTLHQWIVEPDFDQEGEVLRAARHLALKNAIGLLDSLVTAGVAVEVTHRCEASAVRAQGSGAARCRGGPPERPHRGAGVASRRSSSTRPRCRLSALPPLARTERPRFDYSELEAAMAYAEQVTRETRRALDA